MSADLIENGVPIVKYNGLNTALPVDFTASASVALPSNTTINGSAVAGIGNITSSSTTAVAFSVTNSGVYTGVSVVAITANSATTGTVELITANGLTTGHGVGITSSGVIVTTGDLLYVTASGATTSTGIVRVTAAALTTGNVLKLAATAATLTTGRYLSANDGALEVFGIGANGHIHTTQTTAPTIAVTNQAGITAAAITAGSTDVCGTITTTGTSTGATVLDVTFNKTYTTAPKMVVLTAANAAASMPNTAYFVSAISATTFTITVPASATYAATPSFRYLVVA